MDLPKYDDISDKVDREEELNPMEEFIYNNEPAGEIDADNFISGLYEAIDWWVDNQDKLEE